MKTNAISFPLTRNKHISQNIKCDTCLLIHTSVILFFFSRNNTNYYQKFSWVCKRFISTLTKILPNFWGTLFTFDNYQILTEK